MPIRKILVGVADLESDPVLPAAVELARRAGAVLHAVHAFEIHHLVMRAHFVLGMLERETRALYEQRLAARLAAQVAPLATSEEVHSHAVSGPAGETLVSVADELGADLVVVGATRQGVIRQILGSTADRVIRTARMPVLLMKPPYETRLGRVLLTTDRSELSAASLARGAEIAAELAAPGAPEVRCVEVAWGADWAAMPSLPERLQDEEHEELRHFLARLRLPFEAIASRVRLGDPSKEIVAEATEWNADLIITGTRGRAGVSRFLLGSVASSILRSALCNVLVVPTGGVSSSGVAEEGEAAEAGRE